MKYLIIVSTLFVIGSLIGYIIEVFFRRFFSQKKWVNPGFLVGPYIPLYGFGVLILYGISAIPIENLFSNQILGKIVMVLIIGISLTLIELIAGLIFIKGMHIKLWDYSNRWGNFKGIICPLFSLIWLVVGSLYFFFVNPYLVIAIEWISENLVYSYFIGGVIGAMLVDTAYSIHLGLKIKKFSGDFVVKFEQFKIDLHEKRKETKKHFFATLINDEENQNSLKETIRKSVENKAKPKLWWKQNKNKKENKSEENQSNS